MFSPWGEYPRTETIRYLANLLQGCGFSGVQPNEPKKLSNASKSNSGLGRKPAPKRSTPPIWSTPHSLISSQNVWKSSQRWATSRKLSFSCMRLISLCVRLFIRGNVLTNIIIAKGVQLRNPPNVKSCY